MGKRGRPLKDDKRDDSYRFRLNTEERQMLTQLSEWTEQPIAAVIRAALHIYYETIEYERNIQFDNLEEKMLKIENTEVMGWEAAIRGMRNPMNSWEKSDSEFITSDGDHHDVCGNSGPWFGSDGWEEVLIGENDLDLMTRLRNAGTDHRKFMRMITVYVDITAPLYW